jgi:hypothetical protein
VFRLDPIYRYNDELLQDHCKNVGIQRNVPKKTLLGQSEVHGFGLYAGQDIAQEDIIGEYTGEIVSLGEVYRRDVIYDYESTEYVFRLNKSKMSPAMSSGSGFNPKPVQHVDATYMGNKLRFINNASSTLSNCKWSASPYEEPLSEY